MRMLDTNIKTWTKPKDDQKWDVTYDTLYDAVSSWGNVGYFDCPAENWLSNIKFDNDKNLSYNNIDNK